MAYRLAPQISVAQVDDALVFLDVARDRYFRLPPISERALIDYIEAPGAQRSAPLDHAVDLGALVFDGRTSASALWAVNATIPVASHLDEVDPGSSSFCDVISVAWALGAATLALRRVAFATAIHDRSHASTHRPGDAAILAARYERARRILPVRTKCLRDSLALRRWLAARGVRATLVIGVTGVPFTAHCWLQADAVILNETSDTVRRFTPLWTVP
jgi:hypothetical protein